MTGARRSARPTTEARAAERGSIWSWRSATNDRECVDIWNEERLLSGLVGRACRLTNAAVSGSWRWRRGKLSNLFWGVYIQWALSRKRAGKCWLWRVLNLCKRRCSWLREAGALRNCDSGWSLIRDEGAVRVVCNTSLQLGDGASLLAIRATGGARNVVLLVTTG